MEIRKTIFFAFFHARFSFPPLRPVPPGALIQLKDSENYVTKNNNNLVYEEEIFCFCPYRRHHLVSASR